MKKFHELKHAIDNNGVDEWEELFKEKVTSADDANLEHLAVWMVNNLDAIARYHDEDDNPYRKPFNKWASPQQVEDVEIVAKAMLLQYKAYGFSNERFNDHSDAILGVGEFTFLLSFPELSSYSSFFIPFKNLFMYLNKHRKELLDDK